MVKQEFVVLELQSVSVELEMVMDTVMDTATVIPTTHTVCAYIPGIGGIIATDPPV